MKQVKIGDRVIADGFPSFIIAEVAWSFDGSIEKTRKIIKGAAEAKADAINFHITSMEDYMVPQFKGGKGRSSGGHDINLYEHLCNKNLAQGAWKELITYAKNQNLIVIVMCNDLPSLEFASGLEVDAYTISQASLCEEKFIEETALKGKPVFLRTGGALLGEIEKAVFQIQKAGNEDIVLICGFQSYPTKLENMNLRFIQTLKRLFSLPVGFADHIGAESEFAWTVPLEALAFGANVLEKHITHDRSLRGEDFESAFNPGEFKRLVSNIREIEKAFGSIALRPLSQEELYYREMSRKRAVARADIRKGEKVTEEKLVFKRSDEGVYPEESKYLLGRTVNVTIKKDEPVTWEKIL